MIYTTEQVFRIVAEYSAVTASHAGVGACELAGMVVSVLSAHPELIPAFLDNPSKTVMDHYDTFSWENGSLSWLAMNGDIVTPAQLRAHRGRPDC
ncbi:hypothetical protein [Ruegeria sp. ANG-R]|uniref:hypothetical protein n=1 Tax=Ruegeria sp. ANG-R TaxID=1577903 RepID=UPI00068BF782|nr:hypothetical protein [Ruegeria sp. ANG-R]